MAGPSGKPLLAAPPTPGCLRAAAVAAARAGAAAFGGAGAPDWRLFQPPGSAGTRFWPPPQAARLLLLWPDEPAHRGDLTGEAPAPDEATESDHEGTSPIRVPRGRHAEADGCSCLSEPACKCANGREAPGSALNAVPSQLKTALRVPCGAKELPTSASPTACCAWTGGVVVPTAVAPWLAVFSAAAVTGKHALSGPGSPATTRGAHAADAAAILHGPEEAEVPAAGPDNAADLGHAGAGAPGIPCYLQGAALPNWHRMLMISVRDIR